MSAPDRSIIDYLQNKNTSASFVFTKKAVKRQSINEKDCLKASRKLMKSHLTKHMQDLYNLSMQYNGLKSLLYSNVGIVPGNTLINIAQRLLSKRRYLFFKTKNQKIVNLVKQKKKPCNTNYFVPIKSLLDIAKPCTHLLLTPSTSIRLHPAPPASTQLHSPPPSSFQPPASSLQHPQRYKNQNIVHVIGQFLQI